VTPDRTALVTGAASGVGLATTRMLREREMSVLGVDLDEQPADLAGLSDIAWFRGDVSDAGTWARALGRSREAFGCSPGTLILCAARLVTGKLLDTTLETFRSVMDVNVYGVVLGLQACLPAMIEQGQGTIVAVASTASLQAEQDLAAYCTSKGALIQLVRSAAIDYAPAGIRINAVCPTSIDTPFLRGQTDVMPDPASFWKAMVNRHPMGRILRPEDVAAVVVFLVSAGAAGMTGSAVVVDCGLTATYDFQPPGLGG
jgi:NAD(P)-dependent dehydrogenase (short-subunit alcohol dehydrogenase family)